MKMLRLLPLLLLIPGLVGCADDSDVADEESARRAYLGLDKSVDRAMQLGFDGYNAATNANIPKQSGTGDVAGTMDVDGKVDQGASDNKEMELNVVLTGYDDGPVEEVSISYETAGSPIVLGLSLKGLPDATFTGSFNGTPNMTGDLEGVVTLALTLSGETEEDPDNAGQIRRKAGTLRITGTATSDFGVYDVDVTK